MNKVPEHVAILVDAASVAGGLGSRDGQSFDDRLAAARAVLADALDSGVRVLSLCIESAAGTLDVAAAARLALALRPDLEAAERRGLLCRVTRSSGRADLVEATRKLAEQVRAGTLHPDEVSLELLQKQLCGAALPEPDLIILCGRADLIAGEPREPRPRRLSGCLLFDAAYAEFHFCETTFARFTTADWQRALHDYSQRDRRFGRTPDPIPPHAARFTASPERTASLP